MSWISRTDGTGRSRFDLIGLNRVRDTKGRPVGIRVLDRLNKETRKRTP